MKRLLVFLKDYKKESVLGPLFKLLEATFDLIVPLVVASIIDRGITGENRTYIYQMCGVLVLLAIVGLTCAVTAQYFAAKAAVGFATKLRHALFSHIESFEFPEIDNIGASTLITRMTSDINQIQNAVNLVLRLFLRSPFIVVGAMLMAFMVDTKAALVFVVVIPLLSIVIFGIMIWTMPLYKKVQGGLDRILGRTRENLAGVRVIRAFNKEKEEEIAFSESNRYLTNMQLVVGRISALMNPLTYILINTAIVAVIWIGGKQVYGGYITQGDVVALVSYMSQILVELIKLANLIVSITKSLACANRVAEVLDTEVSMKEGDASNEEMDDAYSVVFSNVGLCYAGATEEALQGIDFKVKRGQTIGVIGGTGSGKSSLVHLIPRFYDATSGSVYIDGKDVRSYSLKELRKKVGIVMQKAMLFSGTIEENLRWGNKDATEQQLWDALAVAQASDVVCAKQDELKSLVEEGGKNLSGGQKQRLTIARAIVKNPDILILDDSASALDFATDAKLRAALKEMQGEKTIFIVSQRTSSIQFADKIIVLEDGRVMGIGTHEELLLNCEVYREIYDSQFKKESTKGGTPNEA